MKNLETDSVDCGIQPTGSKKSTTLDRMKALVGMTIALNLIGCESDDLPQVNPAVPPAPTEDVDAGTDQEAAADALNNTDALSHTDSPVDAGSDSAAEASQYPTLDAGNEAEAAIVQVDCAGKGQYGEDLMNCNNVCVDSQNDVNNCGKCGNVCGGACENGQCKSTECAKTMCSGKCVDVNTDNLNCGACDQPCAQNQNCYNGECK